MADAASYEYAYAHSTGSLSQPPSYMNATNQTTTETTAPPRSQNINTSPIADISVKSAPPKSSNWSLRRVFLIIVASLVIGFVVGGAIIYLWAPQPDSRNFQGSTESTDVSEVFPTTMGQCTCPICPVTPASTGIIYEGLPRDCQEVKDRGNWASGQYRILPQDEEGQFTVYCDMDTDGGGWTVSQRREDGSIDFYLSWIDYENGFGNLNSEHWLGNKKIHRLTAQGQYELRIDMADFDGNAAYAKYDNFRIGNAGTQYKLILGSYSGDAGDSLTIHDNQGFSTKDRDNDSHGGSCANAVKAAWWYIDCFSSNLNGLYLGGHHGSEVYGISWRTWKGLSYSLKRVEMKIRMAP